MDYWPKFFALTYLKICFQLAHSLVMFLWDFASPDHLIATSWQSHEHQNYYYGTHGSRHSTQPYIFGWKHLGFNFFAFGSPSPDMIKGKWVVTYDLPVWSVTSQFLRHSKCQPNANQVYSVGADTSESCFQMLIRYVETNIHHVPFLQIIKTWR